MAFFLGKIKEKDLRVLADHKLSMSSHYDVAMKNVNVICSVSGKVFSIKISKYFRKSYRMGF